MRRRLTLPPNFPKRVLQPQAGYPSGKFTGAFDPRMGRGYATGNLVELAPGETKPLSNHGQIDGFFRWKVSLNVIAVDGETYDPNTAYPVSVTVTGKNENDAIERDTIVGLGRGQVIYVPGRSLSILATNPTDKTLAIQYSLDEATPGLSAWTTDEPIEIDGEYALNIAAFSTTLQVLTDATSTGWTLRGYDQTGALIYEEVLTAPRSGQIPVAPSLYYTLEPANAGTWTGLVVYQCVG